MADEVTPTVVVIEEETFQQLNSHLVIRKMPSIRLSNIFESVKFTNNTIINLDSLLMTVKSYEKILQPKGSQNSLPPFHFYFPLQYTQMDKILYTILFSSLKIKSVSDDNDDNSEKILNLTESTEVDSTNLSNFESFSCIKTLSLRYNNLSMASAYLLYRYLQVNESLTILYLANTNIPDNVKNWLYNEWKKKMIGHRQESHGYTFIRVNENDPDKF